MTEPDSTSLNGHDANLDALFDVLSNARRRYVLSYLHDADGDVAELTELVDRVTARETDGEGGNREAVATALHHVHLPKLATCGVIDYDARSKTVRYHARPEHERMVALADGKMGDRS